MPATQFATQLEALQSPLGLLLIRFAIDLTAMSLLVFGLYYRRYRDKEIVTAASLFNVFVFAVLTILSTIEFSLTAGFGLFAILALFTLRSEPISKIEMPYFFGSVAIAVICSVQGTSLTLVASIVLLVLLGAYVMDHPRILQSVDGVKITLDKIDREVLSDPDAMRASLSRRLGVDVMSYQILQLDYVNELARLSVFFRTVQPEAAPATVAVSVRQKPQGVVAAPVAEMAT
ncbi:MAG: DUF4956 domain-containing protein [Hyphomicrobium sp.]